MNVEYDVKKVIAAQLNISVENIKNSSHLSQDLGADSLDKVEILMAMEEEFNKEFHDENIKIETMQDIVDFIALAMNEVA